MIGIVLILLIIAALIIGHELAHFLVARLLGFQTPVFGLGLPFGPHLVIGRKWSTEFRVHPLLFGAYASIPELDPEPTSGDSTSNSLSKPFSKFPVWQRATVVLAGIGFYIVFAWLVLFAALNFVGTPNMRAVVEGLSPSNPIATNAGVKPGDHIVAIDSKEVSHPDEVVTYLRLRPATSVTVSIQRKEELLDVSMRTDTAGKVGMVLVSRMTSGYRRISLVDSFGLATEKSCDMFRNTGMLLSNMLQVQPTDKKVQVKVYSFIVVIKVGGDIITQDWRQLPWFVAMMSICMAITSLVPWPGFDGSHLLAILINAVRGRPLIQSGFLRWAFIGCIVLTLLTSCTPLCLLRGRQRR